MPSLSSDMMRGDSSSSSMPMQMNQHSSISDFLVYQMAMGKSGEITITGIVTMMLMNNMGEKTWL